MTCVYDDASRPSGRGGIWKSQLRAGYRLLCDVSAGIVTCVYNGLWSTTVPCVSAAERHALADAAVSRGFFALPALLRASPAAHPFMAGVLVLLPDLAACSVGGWCFCRASVAVCSGRHNDGRGRYLCVNAARRWRTRALCRRGGEQTERCGGRAGAVAGVRFGCLPLARAGRRQSGRRQTVARLSEGATRHCCNMPPC